MPINLSGEDPKSGNYGWLYGIAAYTLWGFFPIYWKLLDTVSPAEILVHRIIWSLVLLVGILGLRRQWGWVGGLVKDRRTIMILVAAALLLGINWFTYIWGVNNGFIVETSLGYFINPLVNVLLGVLLLKERLRTAQWLAVGIATIGVAYLSIGYGSLPWIALVLAFSFGFYGLLKKKHDLASMESLTGEMAVLVVPAVIFLATLLWTGESGFGNSSSRINILLVFSGAVTAIPLLFFAAAAQRIPLSMLGLLQYIAPTLQFLIGVYIYSEPFDTTRLIGFVIIWIALAVYMIDNIVRWRNGNRIGEGLIDRI